MVLSAAGKAARAYAEEILGRGFLDAITVATVRRGAMASAIVAAVNQPRVVQKTIDIALTDEGVRERIAFHKASGWI